MRLGIARGGLPVNRVEARGPNLFVSSSMCSGTAFKNVLAEVLTTGDLSELVSQARFKPSDCYDPTSGRTSVLKF